MAQDVPASPFAEVDVMPPHLAAAMLAALEAMAASPQMQKVREVADRALAPEPGQRILDAGCGAGEVARHLAAAGAEVVALDYSATNIAAAEERHDGSSVKYVTGDVAALDFPDGSFDGVRSERVLQHLVDPDRAIAELRRVTRPGGRVCLIDTDWETLVIDGPPPELRDALRTHLFGRVMTHHRALGRTLRGRMVRAGLADVTAEPVVLYFPDPVSAMAVLPMVNPNVPAEALLVPDDLRERWFAAVEASGERGDFLAAFVMWVVTGTVRGKGRMN